MGNEIKQMVHNCSACFEHLPAQPRQPLQQTFAKHPLEHTSADLFSLQGKTYLAYVDRYSGMLWCDRLSSTTTAAVTGLLDKWMFDSGFPNRIRTDGGPQFRGPFDDWCATHHIVHELTSPYHPQSNGHAESAVKSAKYLLDKVNANMNEFRSHLFAWRNTPRADGFSPAEMFFGRRLRTCLPSVRQADPVSLPDASTARDKTASDAKLRHDQHASQLSSLPPGSTVSVRHPKSGAWGDEPAAVESVREDGQSYNLTLPDGSQTVRNRKFLRPKQVQFEEDN